MSTRELRKTVRAYKVALNKHDPPPLPDGKYSLILADPPWRYEHMISASREIENHYPTMDTDDICKLGVNEIAAEDTMLFLWSTAPHIEQALRVITLYRLGRNDRLVQRIDAQKGSKMAMCQMVPSSERYQIPSVRL